MSTLTGYLQAKSWLATGKHHQDSPLFDAAGPHVMELMRQEPLHLLVVFRGEAGGQSWSPSIFWGVSGGHRVSPKRVCNVQGSCLGGWLECNQAGSQELF